MLLTLCAGGCLSISIPDVLAVVVVVVDDDNGGRGDAVDEYADVGAAPVAAMMSGGRLWVAELLGS